ncbi:hypothetical protein KGF56_000535 [Candida oxycetoniae]|uniref:Uncharacterized protein n=1 Tax=Candida oxycetoniae TaxID=497107 RepID=A0AAI9T1K8_9ASCO|nr:uncharacterized protein KGF56_000535 [Candida oxycetoniae]KAI3406689.1 hypothetical protein KGF56_000535 [Candida oxycetoniae]
MSASNFLDSPLQFVKTPRIIIQYCTKCKWTNRAFWYAQELFQTFTDPLDIAEIALQPRVDIPGTFQILIQVKEKIALVYRRKFKKVTNRNSQDNCEDEYDGFPDAKFLKSLVHKKLEILRKEQSGEDGGEVEGGPKIGDHLLGEGSFLNEGDKGAKGDYADKEKTVDPGDFQDCKECRLQEV